MARRASTTHASAAIGDEARKLAASALEQLDQPKQELTLELGAHQLKLTSLDKALWPATGDRPPRTKRDLARYYATISPLLLPHLADRPITIKRYPNGLGGQSFYQRHWEQARPPFVETVRAFAEQRSGDADFLLCNNVPTLLWLAQISALEIHPWYSRVTTAKDGRRLPDTFDGSVERIQRSALNYPDFVVFDLDPYVYSGKERAGAEPELNRRGFEQAVAVAQRLKQLLDEAGLPAQVKTSGKTGLHIYVPIQRTLPFEQTHAFAARIAQQLVAQDPEHTTIDWAVETRRGKLFVDFNQNVRGKSLASAYSPRALPEGTLSKPLSWEQLGKVYPTDFTLDDAQALARQPDPWGDVGAARVDLAKYPALAG